MKPASVHSLSELSGALHGLSVRQDRATKEKRKETFPLHFTFTLTLVRTTESQTSEVLINCKT